MANARDGAVLTATLRRDILCLIKWRETGNSASSSAGTVVRGRVRAANASFQVERAFHIVDARPRTRGFPCT